jgi:hypothetical protein
MSSLEEWIDAVVRGLGIQDHVDQEHARDVVLDLARDVAHAVARPAAPVTAFLLGVAAGRSADPQGSLPELVETVRQLVAEALSNRDENS